MLGDPTTNKDLKNDGYAYALIEPGIYDFTRGYIGVDLMVAAYDPKKCGNIYFEIKAGEILALKGMSPAATTPSTNPLKTFNNVNLVKFDRLTETYQKTISERGARTIELLSDNPQAFEACAKEMGTGTRLVPF